MSLPNAIWSLFEERLFPAASCSVAGLFNPYRAIGPGLDRQNADGIRRENLRSYVNCFVRSPRFLLVGEAPGWRGCRFSGVPFTSEAQLVDGTVPFRGRQSSNAPQPYAENSANCVWEVLGDWHPQVFLWNAVPFHPHESGSPAGNRGPTAQERSSFETLINELCDLLKPKQVVAVGRVAERALAKHHPAYVRHPSRGGAAEFRRGVAALRKVPTK